MGFVRKNADGLIRVKKVNYFFMLHTFKNEILKPTALEIFCIQLSVYKIYIHIYTTH